MMVKSCRCLGQALSDPSAVNPNMNSTRSNGGVTCRKGQCVILKQGLREEAVHLKRQTKDNFAENAVESYIRHGDGLS